MTLVILKKTNWEGHTMKVKVMTIIQLQGTICTFIVHAHRLTWIQHECSEVYPGSLTLWKYRSPSAPLHLRKKKEDKRKKKHNTEVIESVGCLRVLLAKGWRDTNLVNESWSLLVWVYSHCFESSQREFSSFIGVVYLQCNSLIRALLNGHNKESAS